MADARALVFDLDDTLYPYRQFVSSGFRAVAAEVERAQAYPRPSRFARCGGHASWADGAGRSSTVPSPESSDDARADARDARPRAHPDALPARAIVVDYSSRFDRAGASGF